MSLDYFGVNGYGMGLGRSLQLEMMVSMEEACFVI